MLNIEELAGLLKERLLDLDVDNDILVFDPLPDGWIESYKAQFPRRYFSDELVEFYRCGPVSPLGIEQERLYLGVSESMDAELLNRIQTEGGVPEQIDPLSRQWLLLAAGSRCVMCATAPRQQSSSAILFWDAGAPGRARPIFPSLASLLWYWCEVAGLMLSGDLDLEDGPRGYFEELDTAGTARQPFAELHDEALRLAFGAPGWVWDQPVPGSWDGNREVPGFARWTPEWLAVLGVARLDQAT